MLDWCRPCPAPGTLRSHATEGMVMGLLEDAGYHGFHRDSDVVQDMVRAADESAVDAAYEMMREHGLMTLADREKAVREQLEAVRG